MFSPINRIYEKKPYETKRYFRIKKHRKIIILHFFILNKCKVKKLEELVAKSDVFVKVYVIASI
ncbi:hypothetical protein COE20_11010 [Bacillus cereus]|nr:hypothetical protein CON03_27750 [Bacillus cereus]PFE44876.1 hypothetical protein CN317_19135 [Bacillus cereus]PFN15045.1 hypothetical protein COJ72_11290 [Bacillus cereus]PFS62592.1 hypothetical protein COK41_16025 [Bacillus cereus]PGY28502.1 hypothetical protein COE20_11010 [Bacillus cereus]